MHTCIICIGSNYHREENLLLARKKLMVLFPSITFSEEMETEPFHIQNPALFSNQVALFKAEESKERIIELLKAIELIAGRLPEDKAEGKVVLDIDLISYDNMILKPKDMERDYVIKGMAQLNESNK